MPCELGILALSAVLGLVHIIATSVAGGKQRPLDWNIGPRDTPIPLTGVAGRLDRAHQNFRETFVIFAVAVLLSAVTQNLSGLSTWGAALYFGARVIYLPLYALGVKGLRSLVWFVSLIGIVMVLLSLVL